MNNGQRRNPAGGMTRDEAVAAERRRREAIRKRRAAKAAIERAIGVFVFSLLCFILCISAIFTYIFFDFRKTEDIPDEPVKITDSQGTITVLDKGHYFHRGGEYYVSLTEICNMLGFTLHGNVKNMSFTTGDGANDAFSVGTNDVSVGGKHSVMPVPSYFEREQLFIPAVFFTSHCSDVTAEFDKEGGTKGYNITFGENFSISARTDSETPSIPYGEAAHLLEKEKPKFICDLSEYEMYMNPENKDEYLTLINTTHKLSSDYVPADLVDVIDTRGDRAKQKLRLAAAKSLEALFMEMRANGFNNVSVTSGYRSYDYQTVLFNNEVASLRPSYGSSAEAQAAKAVAIPGSSEHQSGLCIDMHNLPAASTAFASQDAYRWLYANCANFGFILRYPKDKTDITGIMFEPWHYRFVGRYHAKKIMDEGLCLEEYMERLG